MTGENGDGFRVAPTLSLEAQAYFRATFTKSRRDGRVIPAPDDVEGWERRSRDEIAKVEQANEELRRRYRCEILRHDADGVGLIEIRPPRLADGDRALVYVHGGGYVGGTAGDSMDSTLPIAVEGGLRIFSVDYTPAPRARFPTPIEQAATAITWLDRSGEAPGGFSLYAESAGGGLAMGALQKLRDEGGPMPRAVALWSPWANITESGDTYLTLAEEDPQFRYADLLAAAARAYADPSDHAHPWVSAVHGDYSRGFPPTLIQAGTRELFLSNTVRLYRAMKDAGCLVELDLYEGMWHAFHFQPIDMPEARLARANSLTFIERHWVAPG